MWSSNLLLGVSPGYVALVFLVAFPAEKQAERGRGGWLPSPVVHTLSLSIYCTAWTFYGAVGHAARSGLEFVTIYLGPTLVMLGWWGLVRKLVRIGGSQRITSIADLISSVCGKPTLLGVIVTMIAVIGSPPHIALQLQSVTLSIAVFSGPGPSSLLPTDPNSTALIVAAGLLPTLLGALCWRGATRAGGAGLGLPICHEIMLRLDGDIAYLPGQGGAAFRITLPVRRAMAAGAAG